MCFVRKHVWGSSVSFILGWPLQEVDSKSRQIQVEGIEQAEGGYSGVGFANGSFETPSVLPNLDYIMTSL